MGVSMTCFILIIGLAKIVYIRSQTVTITAAPNPVTSGDKLKLTCGYNGSETESGVKWFQIGDLEGVIYIEDIANRTNCTYVFGGNAYNLSLFSTTCDAVQNVYTLSFTVLPSDINKSWCCTYLVSTNIDCVQSILIMEATTTTSSSTPESSTSTTTTTTVTSSSLYSTSTSSSTSNVTISKTSTNPTTTGLAASAISSTFTSISPTTVLPAIDTNNISASRSPTTAGSTVSATSNTSTSASPTVVSSANNASNTSTSTNPTTAGLTTTIKTTTGNNGTSSINSVDIRVIVPAVVVPCGLLIIGTIILLVVLCVRRRAGKNVQESPDGIDVQDIGNNIDGWKQSLGHGKATDNLDAVYTTPDGFIIYQDPAAISTARLYKDKKYHDVTDQYSRPYPGTYYHQAAYIPSTYTSAGSSTHKNKKHHSVPHQYSRPSTGTYGYQAVYVPCTYTSARTYPHKGKNYDYEEPIRQQASHRMATSRPAYEQTTYYPQTGYYRQSSEDFYYSGGGQYWQRSRLHHDHNGRKQQREYYNQYEMADYEGNRAGYRHTKQDTSFYY